MNWNLYFTDIITAEIIQLLPFEATDQQRLRFEKSVATERYSFLQKTADCNSDQGCVGMGIDLKKELRKKKKKQEWSLTLQVFQTLIVYKFKFMFIFPFLITMSDSYFNT